MARNFVLSPRDEFDLISAIANRGRMVLANAGISVTKLHMTMDIDAAHKQYPLRLEEMLTADDENFNHDIIGIYTHLDRRTGQLEHCFVPRYAA